VALHQVPPDTTEVLVVLLSAFVLPWVEGWPLVARTALLPVVVLTLMTDVVMPQLTRLLRRWLYPPQQHTPAQRFGGKHPRLPAKYRPYRPHRL
jgi:hypothetical protein